MAVPEPRAVTRSLYLSVLDGMLHAVMVGLSESYLGAFAVELGHRDSSLALLVTLPMLAGAVAQLLSSPLARLLGGKKRLVATAAALQAASHLGFIAIALADERGLLPLLSVKILFWVSGAVAAPAWGAWMGALTSGIRRERYFAWRSAILNTALLCAFTGGGFLLEAARRADRVLEAFALMQAVALVMRLSSSLCLAFHADVGGESALEGTLTRMRQALRTARWRVPVYYAAMMFGTYLSAPFFTPYMLRELRLDFTHFSLLTAVSILTKILFFPLCHRLAARLGVGRLMVLSGLGVALLPALWWTAHDFTSLLPVQMLSGIAWAGMEFTNFQVLLRASADEHRIEMMSLANCFAGAAQLCGALGGSQLIERANFAYIDVFVLSSFLRALPLLLFSRTALGLGLPPLRLIMRVLSVRPNEGVLQRPILASSDRQADAAEREPRRSA